MSVESEIEYLISTAFDNAEWSDILCDEFASLSNVSDLENDVANLKTEVESIVTESKFSQYVDAIESVDKLRAEVEKLSGELDKLKSRRTLLDYLRFWSK